MPIPVGAFKAAHVCLPWPWYLDCLDCLLLIGQPTVNPHNGRNKCLKNRSIIVLFCSQNLRIFYCQDYANTDGEFLAKTVRLLVPTLDVKTFGPRI